MDNNRPPLRLVPPVPWNRPEAYRPDTIEMLRKNYRAPTLADDFRDVLSEIREQPVSHALVAIGAITFWTVLLVAPLLIGAGK